MEALQLLCDHMSPGFVQSMAHNANVDFSPSGAYASARKSLLTSPSKSLELGLTRTDLQPYNKGLGAFQHVPCDERLHLPLDTYNREEVVVYIERATSFIQCLDLGDSLTTIEIHDCDQDTGMHAYSTIHSGRDEGERSRVWRAWGTSLLHLARG